jgi:hypothetical protein
MRRQIPIQFDAILKSAEKGTIELGIAMSQKGKGPAGGKGVPKGKKAAPGKKVENEQEDTLHAVVRTAFQATICSLLTPARSSQIHSRRGLIPLH